MKKASRGVATVQKLKPNTVPRPRMLMITYVLQTCRGILHPRDDLTLKRSQHTSTESTKSSRHNWWPNGHMAFYIRLVKPFSYLSLGVSASNLSLLHLHNTRSLGTHRGAVRVVLNSFDWGLQSWKGSLAATARRCSCSLSAHNALIRSGMIRQHGKILEK